MPAAVSAIRSNRKLLHLWKGGKSTIKRSSSISSSPSSRHGTLAPSTSKFPLQAHHVRHELKQHPSYTKQISNWMSRSFSTSTFSPTITSSSSSPESIANESVKSSLESMFHRVVNREDTSKSAPRPPAPVTNTKENGQLIIVRHGQSTWNQQNIFIGMTDTPLTPDGVLEARVAGNLLEDNNDIDIVYTSLLRRSTKTVWLVMQELGLEWVPIIKDWRLNERNYGALVGTNKKKAVEKYGKEQVKLWRRSFDVPPPPMDRNSEYWPGKDRRYKTLGIDIDRIPPSECLKDVCIRTSAFFDECIVPDLRKGKKVMIVGHENNLRSIIMKIDKISEEDIVHVELPRAIPLVYKFDPVTLTPIKFDDSAPYLSARYLADAAHVKKLMDRDHKQVYDLEITENLEMTTPLTGFNLPT